MDKDKSEIAAGTHFWGKMNNQLAVFMKDNDGDFYICGGWECKINESEFEVIEIIPMPQDYLVTDLYYFL